MTEKISITLANMDAQKKIDDAFRNLQAAENARDEAPTAYAQARTAYYTLTKGDSWKEEEKERVARAEIDPELQRFRQTLAEAENRKAQQQKTIDVANGLKDKVLSIKDDLKYSANTLQDQLNKIQEQIVYDRRKREESSNDGWWDLLDTILNYALVIVLVFAIWTIYRKFFSKSEPAVKPTANLP